MKAVPGSRDEESSSSSAEEAVKRLEEDEVKEAEKETAFLRLQRKRLEARRDLDEVKKTMPTTSSEAQAFVESPEIVKMLSDIEDDEKRQKALDALVQLRLRTANPQLAVAQAIVEAVKGVPEGKPYDPLEVTRGVLGLIRDMRAELEAGTPKTEVPAKEPSLLEQLEDEAKKALLERIKNIILGEEKPAAPASSPSPQPTSDLTYDSDSKMWVPTKIHDYSQYLEIEGKRWERIQDIDKKKESKARFKSVEDLILKPGMKALKPLMDEAAQEGKRRLKGGGGQPSLETVETEKGIILPCKCGEEIKIELKEGEWPSKVKCPKCGKVYKVQSGK